MTQMTYEEVRIALDAGKSLHLDKEGNIVGIVGEMKAAPWVPDIRDAEGWADVKTEYDNFMNAGNYDLAEDYAGEWLSISGDEAFWQPLIEAAVNAWRETYEPENLDHLRDDVSSDSMDWLNAEPDDLDDCF